MWRSWRTRRGWHIGGGRERKRRRSVERTKKWGDGLEKRVFNNSALVWCIFLFFIVEKSIQLPGWVGGPLFITVDITSLVPEGLPFFP